MRETESGSEVEFSPGVTQQWVDDQILVVTFYTTSPVNVQAWAEYLAKIVDQWKPGYPFLYLHRATQIGLVGLAPYIQQQGRTVMKKAQVIPGRSAIVVPRSIVAEMIALFVRSQSAGSRQRRVFNDYEPAFEWLKTYQTLT